MNIEHYFPGLSAEQQKQFSALGDLYAHWNAQINVISRKDIDQLYERHILHSLAIAKVHTFSPGEKVMDLGTGGGFPGIPLAILFPQAHFHLVDSIGKKIKVVEEVAKGAGLRNVTVQHIRAEELKQKFDTVVTRAVAPLPELLGWTRRNLKPGGKLIALKGGELKDEIAGLENHVKLYPVSDWFAEDFFAEKKVLVYSDFGN